ncbi:Hypothetical_protein [Hexamita inflata]|uniref:Hypothetical_protein n=1 Tax=Hexamita inflata TaxID=28002 RepID=A0AA86V5N2_9EUKA|nr:Hypothetical protein HINF_LOCUS64847 [Hexamita inflata]
MDRQFKNYQNHYTKERSNLWFQMHMVISHHKNLVQVPDVPVLTFHDVHGKMIQNYLQHQFSKELKTDEVEQIHAWINLMIILILAPPIIFVFVQVVFSHCHDIMSDEVERHVVSNSKQDQNITFIVYAMYQKNLFRRNNQCCKKAKQMPVLGIEPGTDRSSV